MSILDTYTDTSAQELQKMFGKSPQSVSNGIARMLERNPDHPEWKFKNGNNTMIKAEGVEWLSNYFRHDNALINVDDRVRDLEKDLARVQELLAQQKEFLKTLEATYKDRMKEQAAAKDEIFLIEQKSKDREIEDLKRQLQDEKERPLTWKERLTGKKGK